MGTTNVACQPEKYNWWLKLWPFFSNIVLKTVHRTPVVTSIHEYTSNGVSKLEFVQIANHQLYFSTYRPTLVARIQNAKAVNLAFEYGWYK